MKHVFLLIMLLSALCACSLAAQKTIPNKKPVKIIYPVVVKTFKADRLLENLKVQRGSILSTGDSSILFVKTDSIFYPNLSPTEVLWVNDIYEIKVHKKKARSGLIPIVAAAGILLGGLIYYGDGKPEEDGYFFTGRDGARDRAILGGLAGAGLGLSLGIILSNEFPKNVQISIPILSNQDTYNAKRKKLQRFSISEQWNYPKK
jgi:hypothetical protein